MRWLEGYWGKAQPQSHFGAQRHLLALHSLDVAAALQAVLEARPRQWRGLAEKAGISPAEALTLLTLSAALHDLGKFACAFQAKAPVHWHSKNLWPRGAPADIHGHGAYGPQLWEKARRNAGIAPSGLDIWFDAAFAHHGRPVDARGTAVTLSAVMKLEAIDDAVAFAQAMLTRFGPPPALSVAAAIQTEFEVAGLIAIADWIGSNQDRFRYAETGEDLDCYWRRRLDAAHLAVQDFGLAEGAAAPRFGLAEALRVPDPEPTPLQAAATSLSLADGPALYILEDLTGAGKTEAALLLAHRLIASGRAEGVYWALPTMATANGLFVRLATSYRSLFAQGGPAPSLVLAHGKARDQDDFQAIVRFSVSKSVYDEEASALCSAWLAHDSRRSLFAQIGVGTIDQALLAALPVKHQAMRAAALARRVLVVDEAHAFDPYMAKGLEHLLARHLDSGGSAIVLSATLPFRLRKRLRDAAVAIGAPKPPLEPDAPFPAISAFSRSAPRTLAVAPARGTRRNLPVERLNSIEEAAAVLVKAARQGRCAVWVRNAVQDVLDAAGLLRMQAPEVTIEVFHARYALIDRMARETDVLARFGKTSRPEQRAGRILIATQVVEQSLDLDFDVMVTDLAPIDLIIQRAGRLHRHDHRPLREEPVLYVFGPAAKDDPPADWLGDGLRRTGFVYTHHGELWRTMRELEANGLKLLSRCPRAPIEAVYGAEAINFPAALETKSIRAEGKELGDRAIAAQNFLQRLGADETVGRYLESAGAWEPEKHTPTRLGEPTATLRLARFENGQLMPWTDDPDEERAWRLSEVSVRAAQVAEAVIDDPEIAAAIAARQAKESRAFDAPVYVPLIQGNDGGWHCLIKRENGADLVQRAVYSPGEGLRFVAL
jgi:CRISPR-associated endonuclease/helicase Cas3